MSLLDADENTTNSGRFAWTAALYGFLTAVAIAGSGFGGYFYAKAESVAPVQNCDLQEIRDRLDKMTTRSSERERTPVAGAVTLDDLDDQLTGIAKDIKSLQFDVGLIESDVSALQTKIGY